MSRNSLILSPKSYTKKAILIDVSFFYFKFPVSDTCFQNQKIDNKQCYEIYYKKNFVNVQFIFSNRNKIYLASFDNRCT